MIRYQAVTLLIPYVVGVENEPEDWDFTSMLETNPVVVLVSGITNSDPDVAGADLLPDYYL